MESRTLTGTLVVFAAAFVVGSSTLDLRARPRPHEPIRASVGPWTAGKPSGPFYVSVNPRLVKSGETVTSIRATVSKGPRIAFLGAACLGLTFGQMYSRVTRPFPQLPPFVPRPDDGREGTGTIDELPTELSAFFPPANVEDEWLRTRDLSARRIEVPRLDRTEADAIATLKRIAEAQTEARASCVIDRNGNGAGEYGFFGELAGTAEIVNVDGEVARVEPAVLGWMFRDVHGGRVDLDGYTFQMYLPGEGSGFVIKGDEVDSARAEAQWCCYAWPDWYGMSGTRAFFVNQAGDILGCKNSTRKYSGATAPKPDAAYSNAESGVAAVNTTGADGEVWELVR